MLNNILASRCPSRYQCWQLTHAGVNAPIRICCSAFHLLCASACCHMASSCTVLCVSNPRSLVSCMSCLRLIMVLVLLTLPLLVFSMQPHFSKSLCSRPCETGWTAAEVSNHSTHAPRHGSYTSASQPRCVFTRNKPVGWAYHHISVCVAQLLMHAPDESSCL